MKILHVRANNRRKAFEVRTRAGSYVFPYAAVRPAAGPGDAVADVRVDPEIGREGFTYVLESGREGTVHIDHVLEYNRDPAYIGDMLLYRLTLEARKRVKESRLSTREIIRRLDTSATQFYRLLEPTNYRKSVRQLLAILWILDCEVDFVVRRKKSA